MSRTRASRTPFARPGRHEACDREVRGRCVRGRGRRRPALPAARRTDGRRPGPLGTRPHAGRRLDGAEGVPEAWYDAPTFYFTNPHAIVGPDAPVRRPWGCRALDFELEVAAVVATTGTSLTEHQAQEAIVGYTILNDWSARDIQGREMKTGLGPAKGKDFCTSIGPWLVTADELADARDDDGFLTLEGAVSVNGREVGRDTLRHMGWTFATMIAYASRDSLVVAGDVLASGTTGGGGCLPAPLGPSRRQQPPPLEPGDVVSITVERLGTLSNVVVEGTPVPSLTPFRRK